MKQALEDLFLGPSASPSLSEGYRWQQSRRRIRVLFADMTIAESKRAMYFHEVGYLPVYYFPREDIHMDLLEETTHHTSSPLKGEASYWTVRVGERRAENAAWGYPHQQMGGPPLQGYLAFYWDKMDCWYEEEEQVFAHARDPYKRLDVLPTSRQVRIVQAGVTVAQTSSPYLLLEPGLPDRYYIAEQDVRMDLLSPTESITHCPYKGQASYWSVRIGEQIYEDIVWSYRQPLPPCSPITGLLCFYNERVDAIYVDDQLLLTPKTQWSQ